LKRDVSVPLLAWYDRHARRLPWREDPSPYRVWISEVMLQQTRVDAVQPYFERFVREVPDVAALAALDEGRLLKLWEGLGYYARARNLQKAARMVLEDHGGTLPRDPALLRRLPGIGPYSAGAIASIAYGVRVSAVDGNVLRVVARWTADRGDIAGTETKRRLSAFVETLLPQARVGDFNQALMELGATVCLPNGAPLCGECPVMESCEARRSGLLEEIPRKAKAAGKREVAMTVFLLRRDDRFAIRRRGPHELLANLWEFPHAAGHLTPEQAAAHLRALGMRIGEMRPLPRTSHAFTHLVWDMTGYEAATEDADGARDADGSGLTWASPEEIRGRFAVPSAFKYHLSRIPKASAKEMGK
jgi:A/G-specific adenine glycosylase